MSIVKNATIIHVPGFLKKDEADKLMNILNDQTKFRYQTLYHWNNYENKIVTHPNHRKSYWLGEHAQATQDTENYYLKPDGERIDLPTDYVYPYTFPPEILALKQKIEEEYGCTFNGCLVGLFDDPTDKIGFHSDSSEAMGEDPWIGSVSFGAERRFRLKAKGKGEGRETVDLVLKHGDLLVMKEGGNANYLHAVPKDPKCTPDNVRINLTFRDYKYDANEKAFLATQF